MRQVASKGDRSLWLTCPQCGQAREVGAKEDVTAEKTCAACGHRWPPHSEDYGAAPKGAASRLTPAPLIDVAAIYVGRNARRGK